MRNVKVILAFIIATILSAGCCILLLSRGYLFNAMTVIAPVIYYVCIKLVY